MGGRQKKYLRKTRRRKDLKKFFAIRVVFGGKFHQRCFLHFKGDALKSFSGKTFNGLFFFLFSAEIKNENSLYFLDEAEHSLRDFFPIVKT